MVCATTVHCASEFVLVSSCDRVLGRLQTQTALKERLGLANWLPALAAGVAYRWNDHKRSSSRYRR